jgi:hypothetical protein
MPAMRAVRPALLSTDLVVRDGLLVDDEADLLRALVRLRGERVGGRPWLRRRRGRGRLRERRRRDVRTEEPRRGGNGRRGDGRRDDLRCSDGRCGDRGRRDVTGGRSSGRRSRRRDAWNAAGDGDGRCTRRRRGDGLPKTGSQILLRLLVVGHLASRLHTTRIAGGTSSSRTSARNSVPVASRAKAHQSRGISDRERRKVSARETQCQRVILAPVPVRSVGHRTRGPRSEPARLRGVRPSRARRGPTSPSLRARHGPSCQHRPSLPRADVESCDPVVDRTPTSRALERELCDHADPGEPSDGRANEHGCADRDVVARAPAWCRPRPHGLLPAHAARGAGRSRRRRSRPLARVRPARPRLPRDRLRLGRRGDGVAALRDPRRDPRRVAAPQRAHRSGPSPRDRAHVADGARAAAAALAAVRAGALDVGGARGRARAHAQAPLGPRARGAPPARRDGRDRAPRGRRGRLRPGARRVDASPARLARDAAARGRAQAAALARVDGRRRRHPAPDGCRGRRPHRAASLRPGRSGALHPLEGVRPHAAPHGAHARARPHARQAHGELPRRWPARRGERRRGARGRGERRARRRVGSSVRTARQEKRAILTRP